VTEHPYAWLKRERPFKLRLAESGYSAREAIPVGENLYDPVLGWFEPDGSLLFADIGGQKEYGWDPSIGHGAVGVIRPDFSIDYRVPPENMGSFVSLQPSQAPAGFGAFGGDVFLVGQEEPGRAASKKGHLVFHLPRGADRLEIFSRLPTIEGKVPGAAVTGPFGRHGTPQEGYLYIVSIMNAIVYRMDCRGHAESYARLDLIEPKIMPINMGWAPEWWGDLAGEMIVWGKQGCTWMDAFDPKYPFSYWHIDASGRVNPEPIEPRPSALAASNMSSFLGHKAPAEFGRFGGDIFFVDEGEHDLMHRNYRPESSVLPYDAKLMRIDKNGNAHVFADNFFGGFTDLRFQKNRLIMGLLGKGYSTGDYHHPDAAIYEIKVGQ